MLFKTREVDGEPEITPVGCLFIIITLPFWALVALLSPLSKFFRRESATLYTVKPLSPEMVRRRRKRFFDKVKVIPEEFWDTDISYKQIEVPKRSGGYRLLSIPSDSLKTLQKTLAVAFEDELAPRVHKAANAYMKGRNTVTNAVPHLGCKVLVKLDIKDFFPTVSKEMIKPTIASLAYYEPGLIARLVDLCISENGLPQGAPTSPLLSNLVLREFDIAAYRLANLMNAKYTRYADDLTFSLQTDDPVKARKIVVAVRDLLAKRGFQLNEKPNKLKILRGHQAQQVCGITLNSGKPTISKKQRRKLRAAKHAVQKGEAPDLGLNQIKGWESYIDHVHHYKISESRS